MTTPATLERLTLGRDGPTIGVVLKVAKREELPAVAAFVDDLLAYARVQLAKARVPADIRTRDAMFAKVVPTFRAELERYFGDLLGRAGVKKDTAFPLDPDAIDWEAEAAELEQVLLRWYIPLGTSAYAAAAGSLGVELGFDIEAPSLAAIRDRLAAMVKNVTETTREGVRSAVVMAVERGYSVEQLVAGVVDDGFPGLREAFGARAQTIALTETATAYNLSSAAAWKDSGIVDQVVIFDGPDCGWTSHDDPDLADGSVRTLAEFEDYPTSHPNCQRAAGPVALE